MLRHDLLIRMNTPDRITPSPSPGGAIQNQIHHHFDNDAISVCPTSDGVSIFRCNICGKSFGVWAQIQMHMATHRPAKMSDVKSTNEQECSYGLSDPQQFAKSTSAHVEEQKLLDSMNRTEKMPESSFESCFPRVSNMNEDSSTNNMSSVKSHLHGNLMDKTDVSFSNRQCKPMDNTNNIEPLTLYICNLCGSSFETKVRLDSHLSEHRSKNGEKHVDDYSFGCNLCSKSFTAQELFDEHMNSHRMDRVATYMTYTAHADMPYSCNICREGFHILDDLRNHIDVHASVHPTNNVSSGNVKSKCFTCQICEKSCASWEQLKSHVSKHESVVAGGQDPNEGRQFKCEKCKKSFSVWGHLKAHLMRHQNEALSKNYVPSAHGSEVFSCEVCEKVFVAKSHLLGHMKTHTDPVACDVCGKLFQTQQHVNRHKVMHTGERPHKCDVCGMRFMRKEHCKRHILTHISDKSLLATCEICGKSFSRPEHLQRHYRMHTGEKPFKCDICDKQYSRKDRLQHHLKSHEREVRQVLSESSESVSDSVDYNFRFAAQNVSGADTSASSSGSRTSIGGHQRMQNVQNKSSGRRMFSKTPPLVTSATVLSSVGLVSSSAMSKNQSSSEDGSSTKSSSQITSSQNTSSSKKDQHDVGFTRPPSFRDDGTSSNITAQTLSNLHANDINIHHMFSDASSALGQNNAQKSIGCYNPGCLPLSAEAMARCKPPYLPHLCDFPGSLIQASQPPCSALAPGMGRNVPPCQSPFMQSHSSSEDHAIHNDRYEVKPSINVMGPPCMDNRAASSQNIQGQLNNPQSAESTQK